MKTGVLNALVLSVSFGLVSFPALGQPVAGGVCKPVSERKGDVGCWILAHEAIGQIAQSQTFWHLDTYPTRAAAEAAKRPRGTVVESLGKVWLLTIESAGWRPATKGERIAEIGPLPIIAGEKYFAQYIEAIFTPGMTALGDRPANASLRTFGRHTPRAGAYGSLGSLSRP